VGQEKPTINKITIPASIVDEAESISGGTISQWQMQTRAYNKEKTKNISRGISWYTGQ
jgi:hypothetical protein